VDYSPIGARLTGVGYLPAKIRGNLFSFSGDVHSKRLRSQVVAWRSTGQLSTRSTIQDRLIGQGVKDMHFEGRWRKA
jgi:hypothetical protein